MHQITQAPWRVRILQSLAQNKSLVYSKYVQLATVKADGRPANRTVVFRGFLNESNHLTFVTDKRSNKVTEVALNPHAEVCWYFPNTREQYRLAGKLTIVDDAHEDTELLKARQAAWNNMSDAGRSQFSWPHPGLPRDIDPEAFTRPATAAQEPALPTFCLVVLTVDEVDYIQLLSNQRTTYRSSSLEDGTQTWLEQEVNP